jgi:hypothetical protein
VHRPFTPRQQIFSAVLIVLYGVLVYFVIFSPVPKRVADRIWLAIAVLAVVGVPAGIKYGTQQKFWF